MMLTVRLAEPADADAATQVLRRSIIELCVADHRNDPVALAGWLANKTPEMFRSWLERAGNSIVVAVGDDGVVFGVGGCSRDAEITLNYVSPDARFAGVSSVLLADLEERLRRAGAAGCRLISTQTAHRFYLRRGFQDDPVAAALSGNTAPLPMRKAL
ncbi:MAG: GNAT family N-acetyltransferase [Devosia sp.]|nr:GNAT family N-acetyltransferase [Devosia sp.]